MWVNGGLQGGVSETIEYVIEWGRMKKDDDDDDDGEKKKKKKKRNVSNLIVYSLTEYENHTRKPFVDCLEVPVSIWYYKRMESFYPVDEEDQDKETTQIQ